MARATRRRIVFKDDRTIEKLPIAKQGQTLWWDSGTRGLCVLVSPGGAKSFRSQFKIDGTWKSRTLGRFGDLADDDEVIGVDWARRQCRQDRLDASRNRDPRQRIAPRILTFGQVVDRYIEQKAKVRQRTWRQTERVLKGCCSDWLAEPIDSITRQQARELLETFRSEGKGRKATLTLAWLRTLWRFAYNHELVPGPIMDGVEVEYVRTIRDRVFSDEEIAAIWRASECLDPVERDYIQLLVLLVPRKSALAGVRRDELNNDLTLWVTPTERVKQRKSARPRTYLTPLPTMAATIFKDRIAMVEDDVIFPGPRRGKPFYPGTSLQRRVQKHSGVTDWNFHAMRHTTASWLANEGKSLYEIGLVLNHAASGITSNYVHSYPLELKRSLLETWADHVEGLLSDGENVTRLA